MIQDSDSKCFARYGCSASQYQSLIQIEEEMMGKGIGYYRTPRGAYSSQKSNARTRQIEWKISLWEWWSVWQQSGHWDERGVAGYVMCRVGDTGPYAIGNVFIGTNRKNVSERRNKRPEFPMGVVDGKRKDMPYRAQISISGKRINLGHFANADDAHASYLSVLSQVESLTFKGNAYENGRDEPSLGG